MFINWSKPLETTDGYPARLVCQDRRYSKGKNQSHQYVVLVDNGTFEEVACYPENGIGLNHKLRNRKRDNMGDGVTDNRSQPSGPEPDPAMPEFDPAMPCWTRDGRKATIYTTTHGDPDGFCIVGAVERCSTVIQWTGDGRYSQYLDNNDLDLTNTPPKKKYQAWVNLYSGGNAFAFVKKEHADKCSSDRVECRLIEWEA